MSAKTNLQQLAKTLAQKKNISQKDAEAFLRTFFDSIIQNVTEDGTVKIKGLGTFKLIEVLDRESVNVHTGERIVIPGHSKLSFTPETALKDLVNKPFADFQTVAINEGTDIEEMERVPEEDEEEATSPDPTPTIPEVDAPEPELTSKPTSEAEQESASEPEPAFVSEPEVTSEPKQEPSHLPEPEPIPEPTEPNGSSPDVTNDDDTKRPSSLWKICAWALGVLLLCLLCYLFGYKHSQKEEEPPVPQESEVQVEIPVETPAPEEQYAQVPGGKYKIVGTRKTYVMKPGDFVTRIAIQEYGDKDIAQYIIVHNAFPDPDNVPVDSEIKLPELEPVE